MTDLELLSLTLRGATLLVALASLGVAVKAPHSTNVLI